MGSNNNWIADRRKPNNISLGILRLKSSSGNCCPSYLKSMNLHISLCFFQHSAVKVLQINLDCFRVRLHSVRDQ